LAPYPNKKVRANTVIALKVPDQVDNAEVIKIMSEKFKILIAGGMGELKKSIFRIGCMGIVSEFDTLSTICALIDFFKINFLNFQHRFLHRYHQNL